MDKEPTIRLRHGRALGLCASGQEKVADRYGVDFMDFCKNGVPAAQYENHTNPLLRKAAKLAMEEWELKNNG